MASMFFSSASLNCQSIFSASVYTLSEPYDGGILKKKFFFFFKSPIIQCDEGSVLKLSFILRFQVNIAGVEIRMQNYGKKSKLPHRVGSFFFQQVKDRHLLFFCHKMAWKQCCGSKTIFFISGFWSESITSSYGSGFRSGSCLKGQCHKI
jgi:hypothetical protein